MIKFIDVEATMQTSGIPIPNKIIWDSGKVYEIDKVLEIKKRASTKGGGAGLRYLVKLKNQGMTILRSGRRGDLFVKLRVETPVNLSARQKELLEAKAEHSGQAG